MAGSDADRLDPHFVILLAKQKVPLAYAELLYFPLPLLLRFRNSAAVDAARFTGVKQKFSANCLTRAYKHLGYLSGILTAHFGHNASLLNYGIVLFAPRRAGSQPYSIRCAPVPSAELLAKYNQIVSQDVSEEFSALGPIREKISLLERLLATSYLRANLNSFYIPGTVAHLRRFRREDTLITGCDAGHGHASIVTYNRRGEFGECRVSLRWLLLGLLSRYESRLADNDAFRPLGHVNDLRSIAVRAAFPTYFDRDAVLSQIQSHLESAPPAPFVTAGDESRRHDHDGWYGVSVYDSLIEYLRQSARWPEQVDLRSTRMLWEHKTLMLERLRVFGELGLVVPMPVMSVFQTVAARAHAFHLYFVQCRREGRRDPAFDPIRCIESIRQDEIDGLAEVLRHNRA
jgi:hypothetical protein